MRGTRIKNQKKDRKSASVDPLADCADQAGQDRRSLLNPAPISKARSSSLLPRSSALPRPLPQPSHRRHFWPLTDADFFGSYLPAKSLLCRFCRDYSDHVTISIKARIGDGHHYRVEELNTLIDKLLLVAEDAEAMPATGWEPPSVRLY